MSDINLLTTDWTHHQDDIRAVRKTVFIQEQNVPEEEEWDDWDPVSQHILAYTANRDAVGTARVQPDGKITRMAVLAAWRGHGIGAALLERSVVLADATGHTPWLHAQWHARRFYRAYGFATEGEPFDEAGIRHCLMRRSHS